MPGAMAGAVLIPAAGCQVSFLNPFFIFHRLPRHTVRGRPWLCLALKNPLLSSIIFKNEIYEKENVFTA